MTSTSADQGPRRIAHRIAGDLEFDYQTLLVPDDADQVFVTLVPRAGTATSDRLRLLASWCPELPTLSGGDDHPPGSVNG